MSTHPLWRPYEQVSDADIAAARVAGVRASPPEVVAPDPAWPERFVEVREQLGGALGDVALEISHVGSTSVPGLWAKPIIDVDLLVPDNADETAYVPALEALGYELRVREPDWFEHRCLAGPAPKANVHVWAAGATQEAQRHAAFRDWLVADDDDRAAYGALKRDLAAQGFSDTMHYNNAKAALIYDIYERIFVADLAHDHDPHPRPSDGR